MLTARVEFFGAGKDLRSIHQGDAEEFVLLLKEKGSAEATVSRRIKHAKQFFSAALRRRPILSDPFAELKPGGQENKARFYFVSLDQSYQVLDACPDAEWRQIFALSRGTRRSKWPIWIFFGSISNTGANAALETFPHFDLGGMDAQRQFVDAYNQWPNAVPIYGLAASRFKT